MGLIGRLFGSKRQTKVELVCDRIWMTAEAKFAGLAQEAEVRSRCKTVAVLLVAHFPDVLAKLEEIAHARAWDAPCQAALASDLKPELAASLKLDESALLDVIVGERHPLPSVDDRLVEFAQELPCRCRFSHHLSLDDALLSVFAGEWVKSVLKQLGMKENSAVESQLVSRRIRQAQQEIEGRACGSLPAESAAAWLEMNYPELRRK